MAHCSAATCTPHRSLNAAERFPLVAGQTVDVPQWRRHEGTAYSLGIYSGVVTAVRGQRLDVMLVEDPDNSNYLNLHRRSVRMTSWRQAAIDVLPICTDPIEAGFVEYW